MMKWEVKYQPGQRIVRHRRLGTVLEPCQYVNLNGYIVQMDDDELGMVTACCPIHMDPAPA